MLFYISFAILLIGLGTGYFFLFFKPKRQIEQFCSKARNLGYNVKLIPYNPLKYFVNTYVTQDNRSLEIFKKQLKNYDIIVGNLFTKLSILPNHTDIIKDLFNQSSKLHKNPFFFEVFKLFADGGIPLAEGQDWKRKQKIISSVFHFDFLNQMIPVIEAQTEEQMKRIDEKIHNKQTLNLFQSFSRIASMVVVKCFFGTDVNEYSINGKSYCEFYLKFLDEMIEYTQTFERLAFGMLPYNFGLTKKARELKKNMKLICSIASQVIDKQLLKLKNNQFTQKNLLTTLYQNGMLNQTEVSEPTKYTKYEIMGQFFSFFGAGTDTSANLINLIMHYLSQNQDCLEKLQQEIQQVKNLQGQQKLKSMKWTDAVINQALRLGDPAAGILPRVIAQDLTAGGLRIPKNTSLSIFPIMNMYKEEYFQKPFEFLPERWMKNPNVQPYTYIPFSAGERNCIGQYLAKIESKIIIEKIVTKYKFKAKYPIKMRYQFAYATDHGQFEMEIKA